MLFTKADKIRIANGELTATLRVWKRTQAKTGGHYNIAPYGAIEITGVDKVPLKEISTGDLEQAGYPTVQAAAARLQCGLDEAVHRVTFRYLGSEAVKQPTVSTAGAAELDQISRRLARMDRENPWTARTLDLIAGQPGVRAADLAAAVGQDKLTFKRNVRKLKALGLTSSLPAGYELTPRGRQILAIISS